MYLLPELHKMHYSNKMTSLQVRDLPEHIHFKLLELSRRENRSLAQQAISVLAVGLNLVLDSKARRKEAILATEVLHSDKGSVVFPDPVHLIHVDRNR